MASEWEIGERVSPLHIDNGPGSGAQWYSVKRKGDDYICAVVRYRRDADYICDILNARPKEQRQL